MNANIRSLVHVPTECSEEYIAHLRFRKEMINSGRFVSFGIPSMDKEIIPFLPGDLIGIIGRPGHGKSLLCGWLALNTARRIVASGEDDACVIYVSLEQAVEEIENYFHASMCPIHEIAWGRFDEEKMKVAAVKRLSLPIIVIGHSLQRRRRNLPELTMETIYNSIKSVEDEFGKKAKLVLIDYIQKVGLSGYLDRTQQVVEAVMKAKPLAIAVGSPIVMAIQGSREIDSYKSKIPTAKDCMHSSCMEQECDKLFGLWFPALTETDKIGQEVLFNGVPVKLTSNLLICKCLKQRWYRAGQVFMLYVEHATMTCRDYSANPVIRSDTTIDF